MAIREGRSFVDVEAMEPTPRVRMLDYVMDFCFIVEDRLSELGMSRSDLAKRLGKRPSSVTRVLSGGANVTLQTIAEYDAALGLNLRIGCDPDIVERPGVTVRATATQSARGASAPYVVRGETNARA